MINRKYCQENKIVIQLVSLACLVCVFLAAVPSLTVAAEVSASLNARSFPLDRAAAFTVTVKGGGDFQPMMPEIAGLRFHQRGKSTQMEIINGAYSSSVTLTYLIQAEHVGQFTIPAITVKTEDGTAITQAVNFEVTAPNTAATRQQATASSSGSTARLRSGEAEKLAFLRVIPAKEQSYSGEVVPVQIKVYFRDGIKANLNSLPQLHGEGYVLQQLSREPSQTRELINNTPYAVLSWDSALSGIKEGAHKISVEIDATLLLPQQQQQRGGSPFGNSMFNDPFFNNFFSSYQEKAVKVASPPHTFTVMPLPKEGKPENFTGAIGNFALSVSANPVELALGDPITLRMTVSGQGNFDRVQAPTLSLEKGWKTYTPSSELFKDTHPGKGKKVFEQALVLKDPALHAIPSILFSYFDPDTAEYKTLSADPIPLSITGGDKSTENSVQTGKETVQTKKVEQAVQHNNSIKPAIEGLAPLQLDAGSMTQTISPLFARKWFQLLAGLLLISICISTGMKIRAARYAANPQLQRAVAMKNMLKIRLKDIDQALIAQDSKAFLISCRKAIQEQLGLSWGVETDTITLADLQKRLPEDSALVAIFKAADESVYGGQELNTQEMQDFSNRLTIDLEGLL